MKPSLTARLAHQATFVFAVAFSAIATPALAASENASQAGHHSALAVSHTAIASSKIVAAVAATPLVITGNMANAAERTGDTLMRYALSNEPLEISDATVVAGPAPRDLNLSGPNKR
ncbi:hypothetical protein [Teredinibacter purpureus]|uniref:hypothetical protein n=1 Tax=Teredinibacter purpureus TaxID=2731756 RepID=UPI0005F7784B|nr:hypothetical protein [Teredinibacter purpureus]